MDENQKSLFWLYLILLGAVNFFSFIAMTFYLGGDAMNGMIKDGHYYLNQKGHYTETTKAIFIYSKLHFMSLIITHPLALLGISKVLKKNKNLK